MWFWLLLFIVAVLALAWRPSSLRTATASLGALLLAFTLFGPSAPLFKLLLWLLFAAVAAALNLPNFRQDWISRPALRWASGQLPAMSRTEQEALEAGTVWWEGELFAGKPDWHKLLTVPTPGLSQEEQKFLDGPVETFCNMLREWEITHERTDLPPKAWNYLKSKGFFAMVIPKEYGGLGYSAAAHAAVLAKIGSTPAGMTAGSIVAVPNSLGPGELLLKYGTEEQKNHYLPRLAKGEEIPCFALTSPWAGSDAGAIPDTGVVCRGEYNGEEITGMRLSWDKRYITLAPVATLLGLAIKLEDPDGLIGDDPQPGVTCCLIPADTPGVEIGKRHMPLNSPFMNGPTRGQDIFVPLDTIIGGVEQAGQGWRMLTECLAVGRAISLPSGATGTLLGMARSSGAYARIRRQFGRPVGEFEGVAEALGRLGGRAWATAAISRMTAGAVDLGEKPSVPSAIAKYHCTEMMRAGSQDAMDIHAGKGVMLGPNNWLGANAQSAPVYITVEGANILTRSMIIFGQGALRCHPYLMQELAAIADEDEQRFDELLFAHIGHVYSNGARAFVHALTGSRLAAAPDDSPARRHFQRTARYSAAFALLADFAALSLGNELKLRESLSGRLGDALSWLYILSAALKRYEDSGRREEDEAPLEWTCATAYVAIEAALDGVIRHLPSRLLAFKARAVIFPLGRHARPAADSTLFRIADMLQHPGAVRDRLTAGAWVTRDPAHPTGRLELCLEAALEAEKLERRLARAVQDDQLQAGSYAERIDEAEQAGILSKAEAGQLREYRQLLEAVIAVDEFSHAELAHKKPRAAPARKRTTGGQSGSKRGGRKAAAKSA